MHETIWSASQQQGQNKGRFSTSDAPIDIQFEFKDFIWFEVKVSKEMKVPIARQGGPFFCQ